MFFNINNTALFEGRIVKDIDVKTVGQGQNAFKKALFTIAVDRQLSSDQRKKVKDGDTSIQTADFIPFVANGAKAETLEKYFCKGKPIRVAASYQSYKKTDANGNDVFGHIFVVHDIGFVLKDTTDSGNNGGGNNNNNGGGNKNNKAGSKSEENFAAYDDEDLPF